MKQVAKQIGVNASDMWDIRFDLGQKFLQDKCFMQPKTLKYLQGSAIFWHWFMNQMDRIDDKCIHAEDANKYAHYYSLFCRHFNLLWVYENYKILLRSVGVKSRQFLVPTNK